MSAKEISLRPIPSRLARAFIREHHYSGKVTQNSQVNIGVYYRGRLEGAMQAGPPLDRRRMLGLVEPREWNGVLELNRMAFTEALPRNSESRALGIWFRLLRKHAPHVNWVVSFADAAQCGDGTIYRASGFVLTGIKENKNLVRLPDGSVIHKLTVETSPDKPRPELGGRSYLTLTGGRYSFSKYIEATGAEVILGYQLRYVRLLNPDARLTVPTIPFERITEVGANMYRGVRDGGLDMRGTSNPTGEGGASPTPSLHDQRSP